MKFNDFDIAVHKSNIRVGRGIASGQGKTAGRGTKGQMSRTGSKKRPGFEGGQNPLMQRLPKLPGFRSYRVKSEVVYTGQLENLKTTKVTTVVLADAGLISSPYVVTKLLVKGDLTKKMTVELQAASEQAKAAIAKAGGTFEKQQQVKRSTKKQTEKPKKS